LGVGGDAVDAGSVDDGVECDAGMPEVRIDEAFADKEMETLLRRHPDEREKVRSALERLGDDPAIRRCRRRSTTQVGGSGSPTSRRTRQGRGGCGGNGTATNPTRSSCCRSDRTPGNPHRSMTPGPYRQAPPLVLSAGRCAPSHRKSSVSRSYGAIICWRRDAQCAIADWGVAGVRFEVVDGQVAPHVYAAHVPWTRSAQGSAAARAKHPERGVGRWQRGAQPTLGGDHDPRWCQRWPNPPMILA